MEITYTTPKGATWTITNILDDCFLYTSDDGDYVVIKKTADAKTLFENGYGDKADIEELIGEDI